MIVLIEAGRERAGGFRHSQYPLGLGTLQLMLLVCWLILAVFAKTTACALKLGLLRGRFKCVSLLLAVREELARRP